MCFIIYLRAFVLVADFLVSTILPIILVDRGDVSLFVGLSGAGGLVGSSVPAGQPAPHNPDDLTGSETFCSQNAPNPNIPTG